MITAKTLYPDNFGVQFEAYFIEKSAGHVKEAARCFSELISKFQQQAELLKEIEKVTVALRAESDSNDQEKQFLCEMFRHISSDVQHKLLLCTADNCEDTMEHCRLLLLLLQRFPTAIASNGPRLVETLISAEKHSEDGHIPINSYRKLLVAELLPLLAHDNNKVELSPKLLYKLLNKSIEFYICYLGLSASGQEAELKMDDPWKKLFHILEFIGKQLNWDPFLTNFKNNWSKEGYWQILMNYYQSKQSNSDDRQLIFCLCVFFMHCLYEYKNCLTPESSPGQIPTSFVLVEAFTDKNLPLPVTETKAKKRKSDNDYLFPHISVEKSDFKNMPSNFMICVNCWDLINSSEMLQREFAKLTSFLKLDKWMANFMIDYSIYKERYEEALIFLHKVVEPSIQLSKFIRIASIFFNNKNYPACFEAINSSMPLLPSNNSGSFSNLLIVGGNQRHLHYLPITRFSVLQYLVKILLRCILNNLEKNNYSELAIGNIFTLVQLDWPQEEDVVPPLIEHIKQHGSFHYPLFQNYLINVDVLEELTYLWTQGGQIQLDILPHLGSQRRIGTRGADKGVKEEIKQCIKRQIARSNENLDILLENFITLERNHIKPCLL
ncbi:integrator complex subunit 10 isoform X2 [Aethina tumida]|nr:integrator complex subunit 10 isoform X2 [Aethina tumida]